MMATMPDKDLTTEDVRRNQIALRYVKAWLTYRGMTQKRLADMIGMSEPAVSKWLRGKQSMTLAQFTLVADLLDARPDELLFAPPDRSKATRYRKIAEGIKDMSDDNLDTLAALIDAMRKK